MFSERNDVFFGVISPQEGKSVQSSRSKNMHSVLYGFRWIKARKCNLKYILYYTISGKKIIPPFALGQICNNICMLVTLS